jgi:hypothetical protein
MIMEALKKGNNQGSDKDEGLDGDAPNNDGNNSRGMATPVVGQDWY